MSGYNNIFDPYRGSLCGRFPAGPVFVSVFIALMDRDGHVDFSVEALHRMTGWPKELLQEAIHDLSQPDPLSRTPDFEGRRIVLIDPKRPWGWRVVNASAYREKARLMAKAASERESGRNAQRMKDRRRPPETAEDRLSYSDSNTETESDPVVGLNQDLPLSAAATRGRDGVLSEPESSQTSEPPASIVQTAKTAKTAPAKLAKTVAESKRGTRLGDFPLTPERRKVAQQQGIRDVDLAHREFCNYWRAKAGRDATKLDWEATWENRCIELGKRERDRRMNAKHMDAPPRQTPPDFPQ